MNPQNEWIMEAHRKMTMLTETKIAAEGMERTLEYLERLQTSPDRKLAIECIKAALLFMEKDRTALTL